MLNAVQLCNCDEGSCRVAACSAAVLFIRRWWCQQQACSTRSIDREAEIKCEYRWKVGNNSRGFKPGPAKMTMVFIGQHKKWPRLSAAAWHTFGPRYWFRFQIAARLRAQAAPAPPHKSEFDTSPSPGAVNSENVKIPGNCRAFLEKISFHYEAQFVHISTGR